MFGQPLLDKESLRDVFALAAMNKIMEAELKADFNVPFDEPLRLAHGAYRMADAMMEAREG